MTSAQRFLVLALATAGFAGSATISWFVLDGLPHVTDGVAYLFQARIFASGRAWLEAPPVPLSFAQANLIVPGDRWLAMYPPGWPALLALGSRVGAAWLVNPLLLAASVFAVARLGRTLFRPAEGMLAALLLVASPFGLLMSAGFMAHTASLCLSLWCLVALVEASRGEGVRGWVLAGLLGGAAVTVRPFTPVALLAPAVSFAAWEIGRREGGLALARPLLGLVAGVALPLAALGWLQWAAFGSPFTLGYRVFAPDASFTGFAGQHGSLLSNLWAGLPFYLRELASSLWGWPFPDWLILAPLLLPVKGDPAERRAQWMLAACAASLVLGYAAHHHRDVVYGGPRLVFEALGPLSLLAARSLCIVGRRLGGELLAHGSQRRLATSAAIALLLFSPLGQRLPREIERHADWYYGVSSEPLREADRAGVGPEALIFYSGPSFAYAPLLLANDVDVLAGGRVWVRDVPAERAALRALADRPEIWQLELSLEPLPGPNPHPDRFALRELVYRRLRPPARDR